MSATNVLAELLAARALVLLRAEDIADDILDAFADGGIRALEVSMVARDATRTIRRLRTRHPHLLVGAGTVRTAGQAREAVAAGAMFLVSPGASQAVGDWAREAGVLHLPGVFTATEVDAALQRGAELLKLFPAGRLGPAYLRDLLAPFPGTSFFVSGGVSIEDAADYLAAGASVVGMGGVLASSTDPAEVRRLAAALVEAVAA
jgi:2-dehydro-3-deoxyphosphogluconate aldolase/(4S)-4-hydroxy-2-oxoglutarate aldolase